MTAAERIFSCVVACLVRPTTPTPVQVACATDVHNDMLHGRTMQAQ